MPSTDGPTRHRDGWPALGALALVSLAIQIPFLRRGLSIHDEGSILAIAEALSRGEVLYRDRLTTIAPLTYELLGVLFDVFGPSFLLARILMMGIFSACVLLGYAVLRRVVSPRAALAGAIALLALKPVAFRVWTMLNYSQVAIVLALVGVLLGVRFFDRRRLGVLFAAGAFAGATLLSKWNFGAALGLGLGVAVGADWLREPARRAGTLVRRGCVLGAGTLAPVALAIAIYASHGAAGAFLDQSIVRVAIQRASYWVPLPGLAPWATASGAGMNAYTYFPAPLFNLGWHGTLDFSSIPLVLAIEIWVKAAYYVPVLLMVLGVAQAISTRNSDRSDWSARVLVVALAAGLYGSMLHRPDWAHLMNIYPTLILAVTVVLAPGPEAARGLIRLRTALFAAWMGAAILMVHAVLIAYRTPVETAHGRIYTTPSRAEEVAPVLAYLADQPPQSRILVLRGEPLYYFLARRPIPGAYDLFAPGMTNAEDDARLASLATSLDQVVYNPGLRTMIPLALGEYAPRSAAVLAQQFRVRELLTPAALVLERGPNDGAQTVLDVWERLGASPTIERAHWAVYRVAIPRATGPRRCFAVPHVPAAGERVRARPLFRPDTWLRDSGAQARFEITAGDGPGRRTVRADLRASDGPGEPRSLALDSLAGRPTEIRFCIEGAAGTPRAGWGEPRVVGGEDGGDAPELK
jgi:hypothetical protein